MNTCLILDVYRERAVWISTQLTPLGFLFVGMAEQRSLHKVNTPDELLDRILDAADAQRYVRSTQTNNTRSSPTSCKEH